MLERCGLRRESNCLLRRRQPRKVFSPLKMREAFLIIGRRQILPVSSISAGEINRLLKGFNRRIQAPGGRVEVTQSRVHFRYAREFTNSLFEGLDCPGGITRTSKDLRRQHVKHRISIAPVNGLEKDCLCLGDFAGVQVVPSLEYSRRSGGLGQS